jgi:hypothetical protein
MNLQLQILTSLRRVHPRLMPVETLWAEVRMASMPQPSRPEFNQALRVLEDDKKQIVVVKGEDRERAKITDDGIARHEEANS